MGLDSLKYLMIAVVFFVVVITGGVLILGDFTAYDSTIDSSNQIDDFNSTLNKANEVTASVNEIENSVDSVASGVGILGWLNALISSAYNGLQALISSLGFVNVAANDSAKMLGIPQVLVGLILLIIVIIIVFGIYSVITRTN